MQGQEPSLFNIMTPPMFVITREGLCYGGGAILAKNILRNVAEIVNDDLYVLPSSIHEVIALPAMMTDSAREMVDIVTSVNHSDVMEEELVVADQAFLYSRKDDTLKPVA